MIDDDTAHTLITITYGPVVQKTKNWQL